MSNTQGIPGQTEWDAEDADQVAVPLCGLSLRMNQDQQK